jgi:hypothetical protein
MWTPTTRKQHSRRTNRYQSDLTDEEWFVRVAERFSMIFLRVPRFAAGNVRSMARGAMVPFVAAAIRDSR